MGIMRIIELQIEAEKAVFSLRTVSESDIIQ